MTVRPSVRVLLTGASGMLAKALTASVPESVALAAFSHRELDIRNRNDVRAAVADHAADWLINTAAYTAVDRAEGDEVTAHEVNADGVRILAAAAFEAGAGVLHFGSDYVFDGTSTAPYDEGAATHPLSAYGRSKLAGEKALISSGARYLLIRTQWLFGSGGGCFPKTMWTRARQGLPTRVVADQFGVPTFTDDLASATWRLLGCTGVLHVVNEGSASWYDVACSVFEAASAADKLTACATSDFPVAAQRPARALLATTRLREMGIMLPHWRDAMTRFLHQLAQESPLESLPASTGPV